MNPTPAPRRPLWRLLAVSVLALGVLACGGGDDDPASSGTSGDDGGTGAEVAAGAECPVEALAEADGVVEVEVWHALVGEPKNSFEEMVADFNATQDAVEVVARSQGQSYDDVLNKYVAGIPSGQLPAVAYLEDVSLKQIIDSGTMLPAQACEEADGIEPAQLPAVRDYYTVDGTYWPGYVNVSQPILYYNGTQFTAAGLDPADPPETLDELRTVAEALKESGVRAPLALVLNRWFIESWISGAGETVVANGNGRDGPADASTFDNPATHEVYEWIKGMADDGLLEGYSNTSGQINQFLAVAQRNSSMAVETSTAAATIKAVLGGTTYEEGEGIDVGPIDGDQIDVRAGPFPGLTEPGQSRVSGGFFAMTNTGSPESQAAAWEFMKYMSTAENQVKWHLDGSYLPTTQAAANAPEVDSYWADDLAGKMLKVGYDQLLALDTSHPAPLMGPYLDYTEAIQTSLDRLVLEGASVDEVIAEADAAIQEALDAYIEDNGG